MVRGDIDTTFDKYRSLYLFIYLSYPLTGNEALLLVVNLVYDTKIAYIKVFKNIYWYLYLRGLHVANENSNFK